LLIGHTLYNDTSVVLRELVQNSIDAIRLQTHLDGGKTEGLVNISWDSGARTLSIQDNGTGMSQEVIVNHLLKVGSSKYQDTKFKEQHPDFSPISRFGIGVLSAFMIADSIEITTSSEEDEEARRIALRSVHDSYLVRLLDKKGPDALPLFPHGTLFVLKVRPTAKLGDVLAVARRWVLMPQCSVRVTIDGSPPEPIGFENPGQAINAFLMEVVPHERHKYRVVDKTKEGVSLAYAVKWNEYFKDWSVAQFPERLRPRLPMPCTCIEGIAVEFTTPGFRSGNVIAVANATGPNAPKTNVARSSLEVTEERNNLVSAIYEMYTEHVRDEIARLRSEGNSLTWAVQNATTLVGPLASVNDAILPEQLKEALRSLPIFIVEDLASRRSASLRELKACGDFWTVDCELVRSSESLIKEVSSSATLGNIVQTLGDARLRLPDGTLVCNFDGGWFISDALEALLRAC
jgi:molecular chaperone HtpG